MTDKIYIFDTTLRDGEQSPGASMNLEEKVQIAEILEEMRVDIIEAGFPIASNGDFESVMEISKNIKNSTIAGLARAKLVDIDRAWEAVKNANSPRIHTFIATSPVHMKYKLKKNESEVLDAIKHTVSHARNLCPNIEWSCEDAGRSEINFLFKCIELAIECGASTINIPDTVGYTLPDEFGKIFKEVKNMLLILIKLFYQLILIMILDWHLQIILQQSKKEQDKLNVQLMVWEREQEILL